MPGKKKKLDICNECKNATKPALSAAKLGHPQCLTTAYRDLGAFNERDDYGATPIHFAARYGKLECLEWLVARSGVSPNAVSMNGATAAHDAAATGHLNCLEYLLKNTKCTVEDTTSEGATVLHIACRFGQLAVVRWLMDYSNATPSQKGANDVTPVHLCAAKNHLECLQFLTEHPDYEPNQQTVHGATPLYFAAQEGCVESLAWLCQHGGADAYRMASDGMAPVHAAAQAGQKSCLEWLVTNGGVPVRHKARDGATPAHYAAASGQVECLDWIIDHGGSFYDRDNLGGTPAHDAAEQGQVSALKLLLSRGIDPETADNEGLKPLDLARDNNHQECVELLFKSIKPTILESLTPHHSRRGSNHNNLDNEISEEQAEKQRLFEEAMMSGSEQDREAIWKNAQQNATSVQPGLNLILEGQSAASPSSLSLGSPAEVAAPSIKISPTGSMRHSRHISVNTEISEKDFIPDDPQSHKLRPPLSSELFQYPPDEETEMKKLDDESAAAEEKPATRGPTSPQHRRPTSPVPRTGVRQLPKNAVLVKKSPTRAKSPAPKSPPPKSPPPKKAPSKVQPLSPKSKPAGKVVVVKRPAPTRPKSPQPKRESASSTGLRRSASMPPERPVSSDGRVLVRRVGSPPPKAKQEPKQATSPAPKAKQEPKQVTSPAPKKVVVRSPKRVQSPERSAAKEQKSPPPKAVKRVSSPPPKQAKQATSPPTKQVKKPTSLPQKQSRKATSPPPKQVKRVSSPPPKKVKKATSPTPKKSSSKDTPKKPLPQSKELTSALGNVGKDDVRTQLANQEIEEMLDKSLVKVEPLEPATVDDLAEKVAETVMEESIMEQVDGPYEVPPVPAITIEEPPKSPHQTIASTETSPAPQTSDQPVEVLLRPKSQGFKEEAVITKPPLRESLKTEDETVTVSFVTKSSNIKQPFPVTHHQLLTGDDLESPGPSDDEAEVKGQRESFTTPGYDRLNAENFEEFGTEVERNTEEPVIDKDTNTGDGVKQELGADETDQGIAETTESKSPEPEPEEANTVTNIDDVVDVPKEAEESIQETSETPEVEPLSRWSNRTSLDKIDQFAASLQPGRKSLTKEVKKIEDKAPSDVMSMISRFQVGNSTKQETTTSAGSVKPTGSVSDRLKMFGGGASYIKPPPPSQADPPTESPGGSREASPVRAKSLTRRSSSCLSVTAFETIAEESTSGEDSPTQEGDDQVAPLPSIPPSQSRRQSEEKLRLDGLKLPQEDQTAGSPVKSTDSPPVTKRRSSGSNGLSPLVKSSSPKIKPRDSSVQQQEMLEMYMNSACLPHIDHIREKAAREVSIQTDQRVGLLLSAPKITGDKVPLEFRELDYAEKNQLYVWKQKAGSLTKLSSLDSLLFDPKSVYLFLHTPVRGPPCHCVYVWIGAGVSHFAVQSAYQHCMRLVQCLPGRPTIKKEFQGHESAVFNGVLKTHGKQQLSEFNTPYTNSSLKTSRLLTYRNSSFQKIKSLDKQSNPVILDTAVGLWVWLPVSYWGGQSPLEISELFISNNNYPKWTPVTVTTEGVEDQDFIAHFPDWTWFDLGQGQRSDELSLATVYAPTTSFPTVTQIKIWEVFSDGVLVELSMDQYGVFDSSKVYLVQFTHPKSTPPHPRSEGAVFVWTGSEVAGDKRKKLVEVALEKTSTTSTVKLPIIVVPEGKEPAQLLNLFKGKCVIHKQLGKDTVSKLYKVSGNSLLTMKAIEVPLNHSSLHSGHCFILIGRQSYAWAGQFASQAVRRGALIIAKSLTNNGIVKLAEGMETEEFWTELGGKGKHSHIDSTAISPAYVQPRLYQCISKDSGIVFTQLLATSENELQKNSTYLLAYKQQVFVWVGSESSKMAPLRVFGSYVAQYCSMCDPASFLVTTVEQGNEGETFWKWFYLQNPAGAPAAPQEVVPSVDIPTDVAEPDHSDSMVKIDSPTEEIDGPELTSSPVPKIDSTDGETAPEVESNTEPNSIPSPDSNTRPVSLTPSQEATIQRVQQMQSELSQLVEESTENVEKTEESRVEISPVRTSGAMKQMSDMINGLDDILQKSGPSTLESSSTGSLPAPSVSNLLESPEDDNLHTPPVGKRSKKQDQQPSSILVSVRIESTNKLVEIRVREKAPVITVMFRAAQASGTKLTTNSALFEVVKTLKIYRALEDHQLISDVMRSWPKKQPPTLLLKDFVTKNALWKEEPPIDKAELIGYLQHSKVPNLTAHLHYSHKGPGKLPWKHSEFILKSLGIYSLTPNKKKGSTDVQLVTSLDHNLYIPMVVDGKGFTTPTPYCFIMKPPGVWREKDLSFYCAQSFPVMTKWLHLNRLFKHGIQLKANYTAMTTRVEKQASE